MGELTLVLGVAVVVGIFVVLRLTKRVEAFEAWTKEIDAWNHVATRKLQALQAEVAALRAREAAGAGISGAAEAAAPTAAAAAVASAAPEEATGALAVPPVPIPLPSPGFGAVSMRAAVAAGVPGPEGAARASESSRPLRGGVAPPAAPVTTPSTRVAATTAAAAGSAGGARGGGGGVDSGGAAERKPFDWEALVGVRLFSWIAGIALVLAALFFLRYSVERGWLGPPIRMALGVATGLALLVVCELRAARRYPVTANAMDAAGVAILFASFYAGHALWNLIGASATFGLLALTAAVAVLLAIRRDSVFIALLGLVGGFATPALLSTGEDRPIGLFGYLLLLNVGLAWVAYRRRWPILTALSLGFTAIYQIGWAAKFLTEAKLPLAAGIFVLFSLVAFVGLLLAERGGKSSRLGEGTPTAFEVAAYAGALVPLGFAVFLATVPAYGAHAGLLFGLLGFVVLGLFAIAVYRGPESLHLLGGAATALAVLLWVELSYAASFWPRALAAVVPFAAFFLASPFFARALGRPFAGVGARGSLAGASLLFAFPLLIAKEAATASPALVFGALLVLLAVAAAAAIALEDGVTYLVAAFFGVASEAVWSAFRLTPERRLEAFALYGGFAAFYLGVPFLARRRGRALRPEGGGAILLFATLFLLFYLAGGATAEGNLLGLTFLLALLNLGLFVEGANGRLAGLAVAGSIVSWLVLAKWWSAVPLGEHLHGALAAVGGFGVLALAGNAWLIARRVARAASAGAGPAMPGEALWVGLAGHGFLLFAAGRPDLSLPPWPLLAVLLVLDLAIGVAALAARRGALLVAALAASDALWVVWLRHAAAEPWPLVAVGAAIGVAALAAVGLALTRRLRLDESAARAFAVAALVALLGGLGVAMDAGLRPGAPSVLWQLAGGVALLAATLRLAVRCGWWSLFPVAALPAVVLAATFHRGQPGGPDGGQLLLLAAGLWVPFLVAPLALAKRDRAAYGPYLAAILAGAGFFFVGRDAMLRLELGGFLGALPVAQAVLLVPLLVRLAREATPGALAAGRDTARLATVAGAILGFVTVAIPLQLEKQWITIGWALLGAALAGLHRRVPHPGLVLWSVGLEAAAFARLALNPAVLDYHPRQATPIVNWFLYAYLVAAAAMFLAARWLRERDLGALPIRPSPALATGATILLFLLLNLEIADFFSTGESITFGFLGGRAGLPEDLSYTIGWALFSIGLLAAGIVGRHKAVRVCAIALLAVTVVKGFLHDTWRLGGLYRVGSLVGLAVSLALVAVVLQKFVLRAGVEERGE
ncbi:MAG: DUF2339 domain-containing protein [Thermoanaerobaculia bacterium]